MFSILFKVFNTIFQRVRPVLSNLLAIFTSAKGNKKIPSLFTMSNLKYLLGLFTVKGIASLLVNWFTWIITKLSLLIFYLKVLIKKDPTFIMLIISSVRYMSNKLGIKIPKWVRNLFICIEIIVLFVIFGDAVEMNALSNGLPGVLNYLSNLTTDIFNYISNFISEWYSFIKNKLISLYNYIYDYYFPSLDKIEIPEPKLDFLNNQDVFNPSSVQEGLSDSTNPVDDSFWSDKNFKKRMILYGVVILFSAGLTVYLYSTGNTPDPDASNVPTGNILPSVSNIGTTIKNGTIGAYNWVYNLIPNFYPLAGDTTPVAPVSSFPSLDEIASQLPDANASSSGTVTVINASTIPPIPETSATSSWAIPSNVFDSNTTTPKASPSSLPQIETSLPSVTSPEIATFTPQSPQTGSRSLNIFSTLHVNPFSVPSSQTITPDSLGGASVVAVPDISVTPATPISSVGNTPSSTSLLLTQERVVINKAVSDVKDGFKGTPLPVKLDNHLWTWAPQSAWSNSLTDNLGYILPDQASTHSPVNFTNEEASKLLAMRNSELKIAADQGLTYDSKLTISNPGSTSLVIALAPKVYKLRDVYKRRDVREVLLGTRFFSNTRTVRDTNISIAQAFNPNLKLNKNSTREYTKNILHINKILLTTALNDELINLNTFNALIEISNYFLTSASTIKNKEYKEIKILQIIEKYNLDPDYVLKILGILLSVDNIFNWFIYNFWNDVVEHLSKKEYTILLLVVHFLNEKGNSCYATIGSAFKTYSSPDELERFLENIADDLEIFKDLYQDFTLVNISIKYWVRENNSDLPVELLSNLRSIKKVKNPGLQLNKTISNNFNGYNIPLNRDYLTWGIVLLNHGDKYYSIEDKFDKNKFYQIYDHKTYTTIELRKKNNNKILLTFEDREHINKQLDYTLDKKSIKFLINKNKYYIFTRTINQYEFYIKCNLQEDKSLISDGEIVLKTIKYKTDFLQPIKKEKKFSNKFITIDIETRIQDGYHIPYCICYYDGSNKTSFYVTDYNNHLDMLEAAISSLFKPKFSGYIIYAHALSSFDGIFLLHSLCNIKNIKISPVFKDNSMINIIILKDS